MSTNEGKKQNCSQSNDLNKFHLKIENEVLNNKKEDLEILNYNTKHNKDKQKMYYENNKMLAVEEAPIRNRLRSQTKKFQAPSTTNSCFEQKKENISQNCFKNKNKHYKNSTMERKETVTSLGLEKINFDFETNPNVIDKYTDKPIVLMSGAVSVHSESPAVKRRKTEMIANQSHHHSETSDISNEDALVNPPLMLTPGKLVGYTPAGQRHEVDLNFERPAQFSSEFARRQFDDATKINVKRMFHELETGEFLPDNLDPNVERKYFAEQEYIVENATKHFENQATALQSLKTGLSDSEECLSLLESEQQLIELNVFAVVKIQDFPEEVTKRLNNALGLKLTPLMFKKNPIILHTIEKLSKQKIYKDVVRPARALLDKVKGLFDVPESKTFHEYFSSEVEQLKEKTKHMAGFDIFVMTKEPTDDIENRPSGEAQQESTSAEAFIDEPENEWVPVENGYQQIDISSINKQNDNNRTEDLDGDVTPVDNDDAWTLTYDSDNSYQDEGYIAMALDETTLEE